MKSIFSLCHWSGQLDDFIQSERENDINDQYYYIYTSYEGEGEISAWVVWERGARDISVWEGAWDIREEPRNIVVWSKKARDSGVRERS